MAEQTSNQNKMNVNFLVSPTVYMKDYKPIPFDEANPRAIPFPDGKFGDNEYVEISDNGRKVTFTIQQGPTTEGFNGTYPDALILFARAFLEAKNVGNMFNRHTSMAVTDLENANLHLHARREDRERRGVLGTYQK